MQEKYFSKKEGIKKLEAKQLELDDSPSIPSIPSIPSTPPIPPLPPITSSSTINAIITLRNKLPTSFSSLSSLENNDSLGAKVNEDALLTTIKEKSTKIITLNFDLARKIKENEEALTELNQDIKQFQVKAESAAESRRQILSLQEKVKSLVEINLNLRKDLELLKQDLIQKDGFVAVLKKNYSKRVAPLEFDNKLKQATDPLNLQISTLKKNIELLKQDLSEKDRHISFLKKQSVKKQYSLFAKESSEKNLKISQLENTISNLSSKIAGLEENLKSLSGIEPQKIEKMFEDFEATKALLNNSNLENKKLNHEKTKLERLTKEFAIKLRSIQNEKNLLSDSKKQLEAELSIKSKADIANRMLLKKIKQQENDFQKRKGELKSLATMLLKKDKENSALKVEVKKLQKVTESLIETNKQLSSENSSSKSIILELKKRSEEMQKASQNALKLQKERLDMEKDELVSQMKKVLSEALKSKVLLESDKTKMKEKLFELANLKKEMTIKEEYYKQVVLKLTKKELELRSEVEVLNSRR